MNDKLPSQSKVFDKFIYRELHALETIEIKFWLKLRMFRIFDKIPARILFDTLFRVFWFPKTFLNAPTSSVVTF